MYLDFFGLEVFPHYVMMNTKFAVWAPASICLVFTVRVTTQGLKHQSMINKACVKNDKLSDIFPKNKKQHLMETRGKETYYVKKAKTERLRKSAVVDMQKLLNKDALEKREILRKISNYMPVNYDCMQSISL